MLVFRDDGGTMDSNVAGFVSRIRPATTRPDANVNAAINPIAVCMPKTSAVIPANSAPTA